MTDQVPPTSQFPSNAVDYLLQKPYLQGLKVDTINVVGIGLGDQVPQLFSNCTLVQKSHGNMDRSLWRCGQVQVLDLDKIKDNVEAQEELDLVTRGERLFAQPMRPSGPLSSLIGRRYGRDDVPFPQKPHALIMAKPYEGPLSDLQPVPANAQGIALMRRQIKARFFQERSNQVQEDQRLAVWQAQANAERAGFERGRQSCADTKEFLQLMHQLSECQRGVKH